VSGYLKNEVHKRQINNLNELIKEISNCCRHINDQVLQNIFENNKVTVKRYLYSKMKDTSSKFFNFHSYFLSESLMLFTFFVSVQ
jgi:hypothetical protein